MVLHVGARDSPASSATPSKSPFLIKIETFLRMNDIAYAKVSTDDEDETRGGGGPSFAKVINGRNSNAASTSWVTFKGAVITDSEVAIEVLSKAFRVAEKRRFTAEQARQWSRCLEEILVLYAKGNPLSSVVPSLVLSHGVKHTR